MTYEELKAASIAYADRYDTEVDSNLDLFITMVEARANRVLKTREQTTRSFLTTITGEDYYPLPIDYAGMRDIQANSALPSAEHKVATYNYLSPEQMNARSNGPFGGKNYYTVIANQIQIFPKLDEGQSIEIVYYQKVPNLNTTNDTNWMSTSHPDIYLAGMVAEIELFAKNYSAGELWYSRMTAMIEQLDTSDEEERWGGTPMQMRLG
tara:strand:+ start:1353 stop:1979 length:627 start_codon:yes stop_codon:yes gene_type:complete